MTQQVSVDPHRSPIMIRDDEIDLAELFSKVWDRKGWVMAATLGAVLVALAYALLTKPTYELKAGFRPAPNDQFVALNHSGVIQLSVDDAFDRYRKTLESRAFRQAFFNQPEVIGAFAPERGETTNEQLFLEFDKTLSLLVPREQKNQPLISDANHLLFQHRDPQFGARTVNQMLLAANESAVSELQAEYQQKRDQRIALLNRKVEQQVALAEEARAQRIQVLVEQNQLQIKNTQDRLDATRQKTLARRYDRIEQLKEALKIAQLLNIEEPTSFTGLRQQTAGQGSNQVAITTELSNQVDPLYLRGTKFLKAELDALDMRDSDFYTDPAIRDLEAELTLLQRHREVEVLQARESDRAFVMDEIQPLLDEIYSLKNYEVDFSAMALMRIDQPAIVPQSPIKPKKKLILAAALVLGGMLGLFLALVVPRRASSFKLQAAS